MLQFTRQIPDIADAKQFRSVWQSEMRTPVVVSIFLLVTLFFTAFLVEQRFGLPVWPFGVAVTLLWSAGYYGLFYALYWRVMHKLVSQNVPLIVIFLMYFFGLALFEFLVAPLYLPVEWSAERAVWYASTSIAVFPAATVICMLAYEKALRNGFAAFPASLPYWSPLPERIDRLSHRLPPDKRGRFQRIEARNQYVEITTDKGVHVLRMSLSEAMEAAAADGCHIHRSVWLSVDQINDLTYIDGNPKVIDAEGRLWSAGRKRVPEIRSILSQQS